MCTAVVESQKKVTAAVEELMKVLMQEQAKKNFSTKGSSFEVKPNTKCLNT